MKQSLKKLIHSISSEQFVCIYGANEKLRNGDVHYPFPQDSDFLYLTGLSVPDLVLTLHRSTQKQEHGLLSATADRGHSSQGQEFEIILWREPITEKDKISGSDKMEDAELTEISGITDIRDTSGLEEYLEIHKDVSVMSTTDTSRSVRRSRISPIVEMTDASKQFWKSLVHRMRMVKSTEEIAKIKEAIRTSIRKCSNQ